MEQTTYICDFCNRGISFLASNPLDVRRGVDYGVEIYGRHACSNCCATIVAFCHNVCRQEKMMSVSKLMELCDWKLVSSLPRSMMNKIDLICSKSIFRLKKLEVEVCLRH